MITFEWRQLNCIWIFHGINCRFNGVIFTNSTIQSTKKNRQDLVEADNRVQNLINMEYMCYTQLTSESVIKVAVLMYKIRAFQAPHNVLRNDCMFRLFLQPHIFLFVFIKHNPWPINHLQNIEKIGWIIYKTILYDSLENLR